MHGHQINNLSLNIIGFLLGEHSTSTVIYKSGQDMGVCTFLPEVNIPSASRTD